MGQSPRSVNALKRQLIEFLIADEYRQRRDNWPKFDYVDECVTN
jgi:hypothetical protein